jgi:hypothetical protein
MFLTRLANIVSFLGTFTLVFTLSVLITTFNHIASYISRMFDLPVEVLKAILKNDTEDETV